MVVTEDVLEFISRWEGFRPRWYRDSVDVRTIGYGVTEDALHEIGRDPHALSVPLTEDGARRLLDSLLSAVYAPALEDMIEVQIASRQKQALLSWCYNVGRQAARDSTLIATLNEGLIQDAASELTRWVYAGGEKLEGLIRRRQAEKEWYQGLREEAWTVEPIPAADLDTHEVDVDMTPSLA